MRWLKLGVVLLLGGCAGTGPAAPSAPQGALECMLVNAGTLRPEGWAGTIGTGSVSVTPAEWQETWAQLTARADEAPVKPLPPGMKAIAVTERPGQSCYSYIAVGARSREGVLDVSFHLRDISAVAGPVGSVCLPNVAQRSLVFFVPEALARQVRFVRTAPVSEPVPRRTPPACPALASG